MKIRQLIPGKRFSMFIFIRVIIISKYLLKWLYIGWEKIMIQLILILGMTSVVAGIQHCKTYCVECRRLLGVIDMRMLHYKYIVM